MAIHDRSYKTYRGPRTGSAARFWVIPRYAARDIFKSRLFTSLFTGCFVVPLLCAAAIYIRHNLDIIDKLPFDPNNIIEVNGEFFSWFLWLQTGLAFVTTMVVVPALLSPDLVNGALPLYLSHPIKQRTYLGGKVVTLAALLSAVTWIPGIGLYLLEATLAESGWALRNWYLAVGVFIGSWAAIAILGLPALAVSVHHKSRARARAGFVALVMIGIGLGRMINASLDTVWGSALIAPDLLDSIYSYFLGVRVESALPPSAALGTAAVICMLSLGVITHRLRAFEVVK